MRARSDPEIAAALARLESESAELAPLAEAGLEALTGGGPLEAITQYRVQEFCWYDLPSSVGGGSGQHIAVAEALGRLLRILGFPRYAEVCQSLATVNVLRAYGERPAAGRRACRTAMDRSGVLPPDLPPTADAQALVWGSVMGDAEAAAFDALTQTLELAMAAGEYEPGARGWRTRQEAITRARLTAPSAEVAGLSWLDAILDERRSEWLRSHGERRRRLLDVVAPLLADAPAPPAGRGRAVEPLRALLERLDGGVRLTATHRLPRTLVQAIARRFGWYDEAYPPRSEHDVPEIHALHEFAAAVRLVRRQGRTLSLTTRGRHYLGDADGLLDAVAAGLVTNRDFYGSAAELVLAALLDRGAVFLDELVEDLRVALGDEGWRDAETSAAPRAHQVAVAVWQLLRPAAALGLVEVTGHSRVELTAVGRFAAVEALRARASAPLEDLSAHA